MEQEYNWNDKLRDDGIWDQVRGKAREEWAELTDDEIEEARGNWQQFVGVVKEKTGQGADVVETKFREWLS